MQQWLVHIKWLNEFWAIFFRSPTVGNEKKFQQPLRIVFKVDLLYNFNYCSQFNLRIINSSTLCLVLCGRVENLNHSVESVSWSIFWQTSEEFIWVAQLSRNVHLILRHVDGVLRTTSHLHKFHYISTWAPALFSHISQLRLFRLFIVGWIQSCV